MKPIETSSNKLNLSLRLICFNWFQLLWTGSKSNQWRSIKIYTNWQINQLKPFERQEDLLCSGEWCARSQIEEEDWKEKSKQYSLVFVEINSNQFKSVQVNSNNKKSISQHFQILSMVVPCERGDPQLSEHNGKDSTCINAPRWLSLELILKAAGAKTKDESWQDWSSGQKDFAAKTLEEILSILVKEIFSSTFPPGQMTKENNAIFKLHPIIHSGFHTTHRFDKFFVTQNVLKWISRST